MLPPNPEHVERVRKTLAQERALLDRTTVPHHRGERVRGMYAVVRDSLSRYGWNVADEVGAEYIPNYRSPREQ